MRSRGPAASRNASSTGIAGVVTTPSAPLGASTSSNEAASSRSTSAGTPAASYTRGLGTGLLVEDARVVRRGVDVLAEDQPALEGKDVDPVPFDSSTRTVRRRCRPLAHHEAVAGIEAPARELQVRAALEDAGDVRA